MRNITLFSILVIILIFSASYAINSEELTGDDDQLIINKEQRTENRGQ